MGDPGAVSPDETIRLPWLLRHRTPSPTVSGPFLLRVFPRRHEQRGYARKYKRRRNRVPSGAC